MKTISATFDNEKNYNTVYSYIYIYIYIKPYQISTHYCVILTDFIRLK